MSARMQKLTLAAYLAYLRDVCGTDVLVETPAACHELWQRAQQAGFHLGTLFVVRTALAPGAAGAYQPDSGDIWVLHDPDNPDHTARTLLHELAHAAAPTVVATTIDAYCDEEVATDERARALAERWDVPHLFAGDDLAAARERVEEYRVALTGAGELAGTLDPALARQAYGALWTFAGRESWSRRQLHDAIMGLAGPTLDGRVLDFDRGVLRPRWLLGWRDQGDFLHLALEQDEVSVRFLRDALARVAHRDRPVTFEGHGHADGTQRFTFVRLGGRDDLSDVIAVANAALLAHPRYAAQARWDVWGDAATAGSPRLYRLWVDYADGDRREGEPLPVRLWILALPRRRHDLHAEAALQRYIAGWCAHATLHIDEWWLGLEELAEYLRTAV